MNENDVIIKLESATMSKFKQFLLLYKPIPKGFKEYIDETKFNYVSDGEAIIGETYMDRTGQVVKILDKQKIFMGYSCLAQYSNGAIRWISYNNFLYEITD